MRGCIGVEALLARLIELAPVTGPGHPLRELRARLGRDLDLLHVSHRLLRRHRAKVGAPCLRGHIQNLRGNGEFRRLDAIALKPCRQWNGQQANELEREASLDFLLASALQVGKRKAWIAWPTRAYEISVGDAKLGVYRLEPAVVDQRNLNRVIDRQRPLQNLPDRGERRLRFGIGTAPAYVVAGEIVRNTLNCVKACIRRQRGAASEERCR